MFEIDLDVFAERQNEMQIVCLETAELLFKEKTTIASDSTAPLDVADLIDLADRTKKPWDCSGFLAFLDLAIPDQVDFLYRCLLERGADPQGLHSFTAAIRDGRITILDLRDDMIASAEFQDGVQKTIYSRLGHWIVWGGIKDVLPCLAQSPNHVDERDTSDRRIEPGVKSIAVSSLERISENVKVGRLLARIALGRAAEGDLLALWERDHSAFVSAATQQVSDRKSARQAKTLQIGLLRFDGLMGSMRVGEAGIANSSAIASRPGASGVVCFGPYVRLRPGAYRLTLRLHAQRMDEGGGSLVCVEAVRDQLLLGWLNIAENVFASATHVLEFELPESAVDIEGPLIEFRLRTNGVASLELFDLRLERLPDGAQASRDAASRNWLPMMSTGVAGQATPDGIVGKAGVEGNLVYGPYRALPPAKYVLGVDYEGRGGKGAPLHVEIVDSAADIVVSSREIAADQGPSRLELFFTVSRPEFAHRSPPPLEFRIGKSNRADILIKSVSIEQTV